ncbi:hypothetical protein [Avibacterium gallinarum]|uniref:hypothetical protein n=1 Tax=Avibacterium gallinarum TaxID=755 RepID=UPI0013FD279A|nr:hypothetical protein [Avibacterium gallinarum]
MNDVPDISSLLELTIDGEKWLVLERNDDFRELQKFGKKETVIFNSGYKYVVI